MLLLKVPPRWFWSLLFLFTFKKRALAVTLLHTIHLVKLTIVMYLAFASNTDVLSHARLFFPLCLQPWGPPTCRWQLCHSSSNVLLNKTWGEQNSQGCRDQYWFGSHPATWGLLDSCTVSGNILWEEDLLEFLQRIRKFVHGFIRVGEALPARKDELLDTLLLEVVKSIDRRVDIICAHRDGIAFKF